MLYFLQKIERARDEKIKAERKSIMAYSIEAVRDEKYRNFIEIAEARVGITNQRPLWQRLYLV